MKSFEVKALGLEELSNTELVSIDGGSAFWILHILMELVSGDTRIDEEEYYGGCLEPAIVVAERN